MDNYIAIGGIIGGCVAILQLFWAIYKDWRGGGIRKSQAEASMASIDVAQAERSLPHVQESLRLGNVSEAIVIQQNLINGLKEHIDWQDEQIRLRDQRETELQLRLRERDAKIDELERRLELCEGELGIARKIVSDLRAAEEHHKPGVE